MTEQQEKLFRDDPFIKSVFEIKELVKITLTGGAVIDILEGRKPKDYDLRPTIPQYIQRMGLVYMYDSKTATTYKKDNFTVQVLKTAMEDYDFKISQASLTIENNGKLELKIEEDSFNHKILIPCDKAWTDKRNAFNCLQRIPHWKKKGYNISDTTYLSLLGVSIKETIKEPYSYHS